MQPLCTHGAGSRGPLTRLMVLLVGDVGTLQHCSQSWFHPQILFLIQTIITIWSNTPRQDADEHVGADMAQLILTGGPSLAELEEAEAK